jgi:hypothetical protein
MKWFEEATSLASDNSIVGHFAVGTKVQSTQLISHLMGIGYGKFLNNVLI